MRIGIIIGRIGGIDGVALETEKWIEILKKKHEIFILSGKFIRSVLNKKYQTENKILSFFSEENLWIQEHAYLKPENPKKTLEEIDEYCKKIENIIIEWISSNKLDLIISENASALPYHLALGIGIMRAVEKTRIKTICHDHDFYWERGSRYKSPFKEVNKLMKKAFPLRINSNVKHVVINSSTKSYLKRKFNINASFIPNVMNFNKPFGIKNIYNKSLPKYLGLKETDIPLFQVTRIIERKGIETAIELVRKLDDPRVKLIITGRSTDDIGSHYSIKLKKMIETLKIQRQVIFAEDKFNEVSYFLTKKSPELKSDGTKLYSIEDAYAYARACTYFSKIEGFGNGLLEAIVSKKPIFVNDYKPSFYKDIKSKGFKFVIIKNNVLTKKALNEIKEILYNPKKAKDIAEYNFKIAKKYFSYQILEKKLNQLLSKL